MKFPNIKAKEISQKEIDEFDKNYENDSDHKDSKFTNVALITKIQNSQM